MNQKELTTDELLEEATARPWVAELSHIVAKDSDGYCLNDFNSIAKVFGPDLKANAELICRAVNSFEAMYAVCAGLVAKYEEAAEKHAIREGVLAMADNVPYSETAVLPESALVKAARAALALADAKQPSPQLIST
jgi:hypothetical protein